MLFLKIFLVYLYMLAQVALRHSYVVAVAFSSKKKQTTQHTYHANVDTINQITQHSQLHFIFFLVFGVHMCAAFCVDGTSQCFPVSVFLFDYRGHGSASAIS